MSVAMTDTAYAPLSRPSRRLLLLSFVAPRPSHCGGCICLTPPERRALRRVSRIARKWRRQERRRVRTLARAGAAART
jgi:hypothetical protein